MQTAVSGEDDHPTVIQSSQVALGGTIGAVSLAGGTPQLTLFTNGTFLVAGRTALNQAVVGEGKYTTAPGGATLLTGALLRAGSSTVSQETGSISAGGTVFSLGTASGTGVSGAFQSSAAFASTAYYRFKRDCSGARSSRLGGEPPPVDERSEDSSHW